ncbi:MAG: 50S ribosomal protein L4 [Candidatus Kapabacteria bacterium]|nr:50S ribosomal protein L4 [Candidatus Kapabacteria bacterium]
MTVDILNKDGAKAGSIELPASVFGIEPSEHSMYLAVRAYLAHRRQGNAKTKTRAEVRGGGKKPFKQKGTGGARRGTSRSPLSPGGGRIHGPVPHFYRIDLPMKVKRLARKSALTLRARENNLIVLEDFTISAPKTREVASMLKAIKLEGKKVLVLLPKADEMFVKSAGNIAGVTTFPADKISAYDVLSHGKLVIFKSAIETLANSFGDANEGDA